MRDPAVAPRWLTGTWRALGGLLIAVVLHLSLAPDVPQVPGEGGDKIGHVLAYGTLMWWFAQLHPTLRARVACAAGFVAMGILIEHLQRLTGYRTYEVADMIADALGVAAGWLLAPPRTPNLLALGARWVQGGSRHG